MGGKFPPLDRTQVETILRNAGFKSIRHKGTSHDHWEGYIQGQRRIVTVDHLSGKKKEKYGKGLINNMIRQSGLNKAEFYGFLFK